MSRKPRTRPRKTARQERSRQTVDAILEAAERLLAGAGFENVTTNQIAELAGVSIGSLYQYFPGKEAILGELIDRHSERTLERLVARIDALATRPIPEALREIVVVLLEADTIDANLHRIFLDRLPDAGRTEQRKAEMRRATRLVEALLVTRRDELRPKDLGLAAFVAVWAIETLTNAVVLEHPERLKDPVVVDEITTLAARYLLP